MAGAAAPNDPLRGHPASRLPTAASAAAAVPARGAISARADVGHVNLTVTDLDRAVAFYRDVIGLANWRAAHAKRHFSLGNERLR